MLPEVVRCLACPHCGRGLTAGAGALRCSAGHSYDVARQGYVTLLPPAVAAPAGDTAAMLAARSRFLGAGHFARLAARVGAAAAGAGPGCLVEVGAGTGYYLAAALGARPDRVGVALDSSRYAARRLARAQPRIGAVLCDVWRGLPLRDGAAGAALVVFAPRNGPELRRILAPDGRLVVVTPTPAHLAGLVAAIGLLTVDERKPDRLAGTLDPYFERTSRTRHEWPMTLPATDVRALVEMGPSARHLTAADLDHRLATLPDPVNVTASVDLAVYVPDSRAPAPSMS